jgi:hypothetical protein
MRRLAAVAPRRWCATLPGMIDLDEAIATLYARQINCGHQTLWNGITIWLGDDVNGRTAETTLPPQSLRSAGAWLIEAARRISPDKFP